VSRIAQFLSTVPLLASLRPAQLERLAGRVVEREYRAGDLILRAGDRNRSLYLLQSGRLGVQIRRGDSVETVAHLHPGAPFGELSLVTGRPCAADVCVLADATVVAIADTALNELADERRSIFERLATTLAERLHASIASGSDAAQAHVVLLLPYPRWRAPSAFAALLTESLARQLGWRMLRVDMGAAPAADTGTIREGIAVVHVAAPVSGDALHGELASRLDSWRRQYACVVLNPTGEAALHARLLAPLATWCGHLLGPSDVVATPISAGEFAVQDIEAPTLARLSGREQLIPDVASSQRDWSAGRPVSPRFQRTVDSVARCIGHIQVGVALGGGGAWAWSHIGVLRSLERAGMPVDLVAGCSMGSVVGALLATGRTTSDLERAAYEWRRLFLRVLEYRLWRLHLARVGALTRVLRQYFGEQPMNRTALPFWANALDVEAAEEVALADGDLVTALMASMALPLWLPPMPRDGRLLVDAALVDPVPASLTRRMHCHFTIAINAIGPFKARAMTRLPFGAYDFVSRCLRIVGHQMGQARVEACADVILVPDLPPETTMLSFARWPDMVAAGEREAEARLPGIVEAYGRLRQAAAAGVPVEAQ
jgi:NTE family protein